MKRKVLHELYPFETTYKRAILSSLFFGFFVFLFLFLFQPFGLNNYKSDSKTLQLAGYGVVTVVTLLGNYFFFPFIFSKMVL